jgi:hypothetical protein
MAAGLRKAVWSAQYTLRACFRGYLACCWKMCDASCPMHTSTLVWIVGGTAILGVVGILALLRRGGSDDLGSVSAAWTTEHNIADRSGDRSNG